MAYNASVNVTQLKEDSPIGRGEHNAYLNVESPYGGIMVWCSENQLHYVYRLNGLVCFIVFKDEACAQEFFDDRIKRWGDDFEIIEID